MSRSFTPLPWKKTFRKLPPNVEAVLKAANVDSKFVVCSEKVISEAELRDHVYRHLNLETAEDVPSTFEPFVPSPTVGSASYKNATPLEEPQYHLGWEWRTYTGWAPSRGRNKMHPTRFKRKVRPHRLIPPFMFYIALKRVGEIPGKGLSVFFQITEVLESGDRDRILHCLNLLQENVGVSELRPVETAEADAVRHLNLSVDWEILRQDGSNDAALERVYRRIGGEKSEAARRAQDRLGILRSFAPRHIYLSTRGLVGYIAVEFCEKLTVFENLEIDHAMFIAHGPAEEFIKLTRAELMAKLGGQIERLVHTNGWEERLRRMVKIARGDQSANPGDII